MPTEFKYPMFEDAPKDGWMAAYHNAAYVSLLNLNSKVPIEKQWNKLDDEEKWQEFQYALQQVLELYTELEDLDKEEKEPPPLIERNFIGN